MLFGNPSVVRCVFPSGNFPIADIHDAAKMLNVNIWGMQRISVPQFPEIAIEYAAENEAEFGPCPDCGQKTKRVWGFVYRSDIATAAYYVEWTPSHPQRDAAFDLIIGKWG